MTEDLDLTGSSSWFVRLERTFYALGTLGILLGFVLDITSSPEVERFVVGVIAGLAALHGTRYHPIAAATLLVLTSFALSVTEAIADTSDASPGMAEAGALILIAGITARSVPVRPASALVPAIFIALLVSNTVALAADPTAAFALTIVFWGFASVTAGVGVYLRLTTLDRDRSVTDARTNERLEMARELHDVVAHHVTGIVLQAQAGQLIAKQDPQHAETLFAEIEQAGSDAMGSMRHMVASLRTDQNHTAISMDTIGELEELAQNARTDRITVELNAQPIPPALASTIVRLTREALTNSRKHANHANHIEITITTSPHHVDWQVADNGHPQSVTTTTGFGLIGMRERVESLGGTFNTTRTSHGFTVSARIPTGHTP